MSAEPPTIAQQKWLAYAPMPFAIISCLSSSYVIYHIVRQQPTKLKRMYHRLVLAMNIALLPLSITYLLGPLAVPQGEEYFIAAAGNVNTCTAAGFIALMLSLTVPAYYGSLGVQAYMSIKYEFKEQKYKWIELPLHLLAWVVPAGIASVVAATENFNPVGSGCSIAAYPQGCELDTNDDVECIRGGNIGWFVYIVSFLNILLYIIFAPTLMMAVYCLIKRKQKESEGNTGMQRIRDQARKQMMKNIVLQMSK